MSLVVAQGLSKSYGAQDVFGDVSIQLAHGEKVALVGPNGEGKTTLLRILAGLEEPSAGTFSIAKSARLAYLPQIADLGDGHTLWEEMQGVFGHVHQMQAELRELEHSMAIPGSGDRALAQYGELQQRFELAGGYDYEQRIRHVLMGLGFPPQEHHMPLSHLSGGQKTRALLARLLLQEPDLLLLDEPTNYLDLEATEWLEGRLAEWPGALIVVSHDRYFLDKVVSKVYELSQRRIEEYPGNYTHYVQLRAERLERRRIEYEAQREQISKTEEFIRKYMAGQRTKEAQGRARRLARVERLERPRELQAMTLSMQQSERSGELVLVTQGASIGYRAAPAQGAGVATNNLFEMPALALRRGQRGALAGPNGSGKTTLLRTIVGELETLSGELRLGSSVHAGYYRQGTDDLNADNDLIQELHRVKDIPTGQARNLLARCLFKGDDAFKRVRDLSGGERARLMLAKLTLQGANLLLLDEPTSHLDIASREVLEEVLRAFHGTILLVSHDRYLISALATQVWAIESGRLKVYPGRYSDYVAARDAARLAEVQPEQAKPGRAKPPPDPRRRERIRLGRELTDLETAIAEMEKRLSEVTAEIALASGRQDADALAGLGHEYQRLDQELRQRLDEWAEVTARLESAEPSAHTSSA